MRQTLFYLPDQLAGLPVFGLGWLFGAWLLGSIILIIVSYRRHGWGAETVGSLPLLAVLGAAIVFVLPLLVVEGLGLPIRGYGTMLLLALFAGVGSAMLRARQENQDPEEIYTLAVWMIIAGIVGARLFFVIQYWKDFQRETIGKTLFEVFKFTEGGLVVYGSLFGALLAFSFFCYQRKRCPLVLGDRIGPSLLLGLAIGRIGCLLNGCCYGGVCEDNTFHLQFPQYTSSAQKTFSAPYQDQLTQGLLHGIRIRQAPGGEMVVASVRSGSAAEASGVPIGAVIRRINGEPIESLSAAQLAFLKMPTRLEIETATGARYDWSIEALPDWSLPVYPTQLYSALNALLLAFWLWFLYPFRSRDGQIFALTLGCYAVTRFLLEMIRDDEAGWWGTSLSIAQLISIPLFLLAIAIGILIQVRMPRRVGVAGETQRASGASGTS